jgi:hypothetical protein
MSTGGVISGTPSTSGSFSVTIRLQDSRGSSSQVSKTLSLSVAASAPENETTYPYPSGNLVDTIYAQVEGSVGGSDSYNGSAGLYEFYIIFQNSYTIWKVLRINVNFGAIVFAENAGGPEVHAIVRDNTTTYFDIYDNPVNTIEMKIYFIKA